MTPLQSAAYRLIKAVQNKNADLIDPAICAIWDASRGDEDPTRVALAMKLADVVNDLVNNHGTDEDALIALRCWLMADKALAHT